MPEHLRVYTERWRELHPGWEYRLWGDEDLGWLRNRDLYDEIRRWVPPWAWYVTRSDIARYEIILRHGGLYVDCDTEPLRPVDDALRNRTELAATEPHGGIVGNTYLAAVPDHPALAELVDIVRRRVYGARRHRHNVPAVLTGPRALTPVWRAHDCYVAPSHEWFPYTYGLVHGDERPRDFPDAYAVHHWGYIRELKSRGLF